MPDTANLSKLDALAKDHYLDVIVEQTAYRNWMLDKVKREATQVQGEGRRTLFSVEVRPNRAYGAMAEGGTLVDPGSSTYEDGVLTLSYFNAGMQITDVATKVIRGAGAVASTNAFTREMRNIQKSFRAMVGRVVWGGNSGALSVCRTTSGSTTVNVESVQFIQIGETIDIVNSSTGVAVSNGTGRQVVGRSVPNRTITIDSGGGNVTTSASHSVVLSGSFGLEFPGMNWIAETNRAIYGIDGSVAGNEYHNAKVINVGADAATPAVAGPRPFKRLDNLIGQDAQDEVGTFLTTRGIVDRVALNYESQKRFDATKPVTMYGDYEAIMVANKPLIYQDEIPKGNAYALPKDMSIFTWKQTGDPDWLKAEDASIWHLAISSTPGRRKAAWEAWLTWYAALGCTAPGRVGRLKFCDDDEPA